VFVFVSNPCRHVYGKKSTVCSNNAQAVEYLKDSGLLEKVWIIKRDNTHFIVESVDY
jgi:hypothetical protein